MSNPLAREEELIGTIKEKFQNDIKESKIIRKGRPEIVTTPEKIRDVALFLRDQLGFDHANAVSGVDYNREARFEVVYHTSSTGNKNMRDLVLALKESTPRNAPKVPSLISVWPAVENYERETFEMYAIQFEGHPRLEKLFLLDNWDGPPPLRKDVRVPTD